jgi:hypothetical protein
LKEWIHIFSLHSPFLSAGFVPSSV